MIAIDLEYVYDDYDCCIEGEAKLVPVNRLSTSTPYFIVHEGDYSLVFATNEDEAVCRWCEQLCNRELLSGQLITSRPSRAIEDYYKVHGDLYLPADLIEIEELDPDYIEFTGDKVKNQLTATEAAACDDVCGDWLDVNLVRSKCEMRCGDSYSMLSYYTMDGTLNGHTVGDTVKWRPVSGTKSSKLASSIGRVLGFVDKVDIVDFFSKQVNFFLGSSTPVLVMFLEDHTKVTIDIVCSSDLLPFDHQDLTTWFFNSNCSVDSLLSVHNNMPISLPTVATLTAMDGSLAKLPKNAKASEVESIANAIAAKRKASKTPWRPPGAVEITDSKAVSDKLKKRRRSFINLVDKIGGGDDSGS